MLNSDEIAALISRVRANYIERIADAAGSSQDSVEEAINNSRWFIEEAKRSGKCVASDHFSVDHMDAMAQCFDIDFQTFRHLDIGDAFALEDEWWMEHASPEELKEFYPLDFLTQCEMEASERKDAKLIKEVGVEEFLRLRVEESKRRRATRKSAGPPSLFPSDRRV